MKLLVFLVLIASAHGAGFWSKLLQWRGKLLGYPGWERSLPSSSVKKDEAASRRGPGYTPPKATCGAYTRDMAVDCMHYLADLNCDHSLDRHEVDAGKSNLLTWFERTVAFLAVSTDNIMRDCDTNRDGLISRAEFLNDYEHCLNSEREMCLVRDICWREMNKHVALCKN